MQLDPKVTVPTDVKECIWRNLVGMHYAPYIKSESNELCMLHELLNAPADIKQKAWGHLVGATSMVTSEMAELLNRGELDPYTLQHRVPTPSREVVEVVQAALARGETSPFCLAFTPDQLVELKRSNRLALDKELALLLELGVLLHPQRGIPSAANGLGLLPGHASHASRHPLNLQSLRSASCHSQTPPIFHECCELGGVLALHRASDLTAHQLHSRLREIRSTAPQHFDRLLAAQSQQAAAQGKEEEARRAQLAASVPSQKALEVFEGHLVALFSEADAMELMNPGFIQVSQLESNNFKAARMTSFDGGTDKLQTIGTFSTAEQAAVAVDILLYHKHDVTVNYKHRIYRRLDASMWHLSEEEVMDSLRSIPRLLQRRRTEAMRAANPDTYISQLQCEVERLMLLAPSLRTAYSGRSKHGFGGIKSKSGERWVVTAKVGIAKVRTVIGTFNTLPEAALAADIARFLDQKPTGNFPAATFDNLRRLRRPAAVPLAVALAVLSLFGLMQPGMHAKYMSRVAELQALVAAAEPGGNNENTASNAQAGAPPTTAVQSATSIAEAAAAAVVAAALPKALELLREGWVEVDDAVLAAMTERFRPVGTPPAAVTFQVGPEHGAVGAGDPAAANKRVRPSSAFDACMPRQPLSLLRMDTDAGTSRAGKRPLFSYDGAQAEDEDEEDDVDLQRGLALSVASGAAGVQQQPAMGAADPQAASAFTALKQAAAMPKKAKKPRKAPKQVAGAAIPTRVPWQRCPGASSGSTPCAQSLRGVRGALAGSHAALSTGGPARFGAGG